MGNAEEGGLGVQRTLLIGGPKHNEYINLPLGQNSYEFTSMQTLLSPPEGLRGWPESSTHLYKIDRALSNQMLWGNTCAAAPVIIFTHEILWGSPYQGGFNLWALSDAVQTIEKAQADLSSARESIIKQGNDRRQLESNIEDWQRKYEALLEISNSSQAQLRSVRQSLELAVHGVGMAVEATKLEYRTVWKDVNA